MILANALCLALPPAAARADDLAPAAPKMVTLQGIRSATVAPNGLGFAALSYSTRRANGGPSGKAFGTGADGSAVVGFGLGDAATGIGLQFSANITSLSDDFGDSGHLSLKASHRIQGLQTPTFIALSFDRLAGWGDARSTDPSISAAVTLFPRTTIGTASFPLMLTLGAGTDVRNRATDPGIYFGAGIGLSANFGASLAWTGDSITVGAAFRPAGVKNVLFSATLDDALDQLDGRRATLSATWLINDIFGG